ncbi:hypothetical protein [Streptomyces sp. SID3343]|uniref:hypothetical protein n=1 Tax=Streptomyces sp. SID3343 TaxID=2690260 RepID=UPI00136AD6F3|nr:hypothetical protein [Streptomyces sp. SID3343]MYW02684.1 hypothetical protein [Streptomyces sp. SID3343]
MGRTGAKRWPWVLAVVVAAGLAGGGGYATLEVSGDGSTRAEAEERDNKDLARLALLRRLDTQARQTRSVRLVSRATGDVPAELASARVTIDVDLRHEGVYRGETDFRSGHAEFRRTARGLYVKGDRGFWQTQDGFRDKPAAVEAVVGSFVEVPPEQQPTGQLDTVAVLGDLPRLARLIAAGPEHAQPRADDPGTFDEILLDAPAATGGGVFHVPARGVRALPTLLTIPPHTEAGQLVPGAVVEWTRFDVPVDVDTPSADATVPWPAAALAP